MFQLLIVFAFEVVFGEISPFKFSGESPSPYEIPKENRFTCPRSQEGAPDLVYYLSVPQKNRFPIAILCTGSSSRGSLYSVVHIHRYFLQECADLGLGVLTVEQWGIDGKAIDEEAFFAHYTSSQRIQDHVDVLHQLERHPPEGWDGQFVFIGVSEGGHLVTHLSTLGFKTIATINWSGAGDASWNEELWAFFETLKQKSWLMWLYDFASRWLPFSWEIPSSRAQYDALLEQIKQNPRSDLWFAGMTYLYHADALNTAPIEYRKIRSPLLVVVGTEDSILPSTDLFVEKAKSNGVPVTYFRVEGMDHFIRLRPDILADSFAWLEKEIRKAETVVKISIAEEGSLRLVDRILSVLDAFFIPEMPQKLVFWQSQICQKADF